MDLAGTIVALATAPGRSLRGLIRVSGPDIVPALRAVGLVFLPAERGCFRASLVIPALNCSRTVSCPCLVLRFAAGHSYTGDDTAEIVMPGNPALAQRVQRALLAVPGVRAAGPGEFTARAFVNGRLSLAQAEGVGALIAARNSDELRAADALLSGETGREYRAWADTLTTCLALVEAGIDFTDQEDVVAITPTDLVDRLATLERAISACLTPQKSHTHADNHLPVVALVGKPNAGKSTLFNALLGRERAVTSPRAGSTRDVLAEEVTLAPLARVLLRDTPGLGHIAANASADASAVVAARSAQRDADVLVWCDPTGRFVPADAPNADGAVLLRVRTCADRPGHNDDDGALAVCALDGYNLAALRERIARAALPNHARAAAALAPRHDAALRLCSEFIAQAQTQAKAGHVGEICAANLRSALDAVGGLVGTVSPDDVIGRVFATFCVGK